MDFLIYHFGEIVQGEHEPFLTFVNRLGEIGKHCNFDNLDTEVKRQIIQKTSNRAVRQKALEKKLSYDEIIRIGIADETTKRQVKEMEKTDHGDYGNVNKVTLQSRPGTDRPTTHEGKNSSKIFDCTRCGRKHKARNCPALGKISYGCGKLNHLQFVCKSKKKGQDGKQFSRRSRTRNKCRVNKVKQESNESGLMVTM